MNRMLKGFFSLALLTSASISLAHSSSSNSCSSSSNCLPSPYFSIRSQSVNAARELVGWQTHINLFDKDCLYGSFSITPEYTRSFRPGHIGQYLFGDNVTCTSNNSVLTISGTQVANRGEKDWLADYFGLPVNFKSEVTFKPRIENFLVDFNLYLGLDEWMCGMYFRIHAPVVYTRWDLNACESVTSSTNNLGYIKGYMSSVEIAGPSLKTRFLDTMDGSYKFGDMTEALKYGKIAECKKTQFGLSDIEAALGWNFWQCEDYHFGLQIRGSAPTGNRPDAEYLFEPIVGNGKHWTLGGGVSAHAVLWRGCDEDHFFGIWFDANITHLFKTKQKRSFDFKDKPNSRYVLLEEMTSTVANLFAGATATAATAPSAQYAGKLLPAINVTTLDVDVRIDVQVDAALKFSYYNCGFEADLGYNLWARSGEKFKERCDQAITSKKYAFKGDSAIYGFTSGDVAVALSATQSTSDIHGGKNTNGSKETDTNDKIDNPQLAWFTQTTTGTLYNPYGTQTNTSKDPVFVTGTDLNMCKTPSAMSHKVFGHISYNWADCEDWVPFIGVGGEVEFAGKYNSNYAALSQWGVWIKGGISFN